MEAHMAVAKYEHCLVTDIRSHVKQQLEATGLPKTGAESPAEFWARVEKAGRLREALVLYHETAIEWEEWKHLTRETKAEFSQRIRKEKRPAEVEHERERLVASGLSQREVQSELVERFQPLDGTKTRAWETPDPWERGRMFGRRTKEQELLAREDPYYRDKAARQRVQSQLHWARLRRDERRALAEARQRARALPIAGATSAAK
jgi:hypothetical protein